MNRSIILSVFSLMVLLISCQSNESKKINLGDEIIEKAIQAIGGDILDNAEGSFDFRDQSLSYYNYKGKYRYSLTFTDTAGHIINDTLTNDDFTRYKEGEKLSLSQEEKASLQGSVNSIIYFAFLPYRLNDPATIKEYIDQVTIKGKPYEKVKVIFQEEGGGTDHDDVYYYYFDTQDYSLDYLAYEFHVDGGGIRFREAYNERTINGVTIRDYINYMVDPDLVDYSRIEEYYNKGELKELSRIEIKNMVVRRTKKQL